MLDTGELRDPLDGTPPRLTRSDAADVARRLFGVDGVASQLGSERDQNFRIDVDGREPVLLKVSNAAEDPAVVEMQNAALVHVADRDPALPVQTPLRTLAGDLIGWLERADGAWHIVRLMTFLPGRPAADIDLTLDALRAFGGIVARTGVALHDFSHPADGRVLSWDIKHAASLRAHLGGVDEAQRGRVEAVLDRFDGVVAPRLSGLRTQVIHNDMTFDNVVVDGDGRVTGIVDFGDMARTPLVFDLSSCLPSVMQSRSDPFQGADALLTGYASITPLTDEELELVPDLIATRLAVTLLISAWRVQRYPENRDYITSWDSESTGLLDLFDEVGLAYVRRRFRATHDGVTGRLVERRTRLLGPALSPLSYDRPLHLVRGEGAWLIDAAGRRYLDAYNNVPVVGHSHPRVVEAIVRQTRELNTNTRYLHGTILELSQRLIATLPDGLDTCMFVNSGSEANDLAWRLARAATGNAGAIVTANAYHGITAAVADLSPEEWGTSATPAHVGTIAPPDTFRGPYAARDATAHRYAGHVADVVAELTERGHAPAALVLDTGFTSDGIFVPASDVLHRAVVSVRDAGALFVADEVQAGYGRLGSDLWGFALHRLAPDIVTIGKPAGNGYPLGIVVTRADIAEAFARTTEFFSTFGGNPVACAAGLAVLDVIGEEGLRQRAADAGEYLRSGMRELMGRHAAVGDVRGAGLLIGMEVVDGGGEPAPDLARATMNAMRERGVLIGTTGPRSHVLKIRPPLVISRHECDVLLAALDDALAGLR